MPIHLNVLRPRQAEAGKIKIGALGEKRTTQHGDRQYQIPVKFDHFILTTTERGNDGNFELDAKLMEQLDTDKDGKIRKIPILLSSDDIDEVFPTTLACYSGRNLHCKGDGHSPAVRFEIRTEKRDGRTVKIKTGKTEAVKCPCNYLGATKGLQCKAHGTLWCTVVAGEETQIGGRHSFRTTSWDSIRSLTAGLQEIQRMVGTLVGPPLTLHVRPRVVRPKGSDRSKTVYVVHVICKSKDIQQLRERVLAQAQMRHSVAALAGRPIKLGLPAPGEESPAEQAKIQEEYHPDDAPEDDEEVMGYDPDTGEVYGDGDPIDADGWVRDPKPEDDSQEPPEDTSKLESDHPIRSAFQKLIGDIFVDRDLPEAESKSGRAAIWSEACEAAGCPRLPWKDLTRSRAAKIQPHLQKMLRDPDAAPEGP